MNSTATIFIKPTVAFNRGDTFVFGSYALLTASDPSNAASPCCPI
jgi:hypothetical protein